MTYQRRIGIVLAALLLAGGMGQRVLAQAAPQLTGAVSRRLHGAVAYDIPMPISGAATGIEGRQLVTGVTIVLIFDKSIGTGTATVGAGTATMASTAVSGSTLYVNLVGVGNAQAIAINYANVTPSGGGAAASGSLTFRTLEGDVNGNGVVTGADVNLVKFNVGRPVDGSNFRCDLSGNGLVTGSDVNIVKVNVGHSVAGGPAPNTAPAITTIANQTTTAGTSTGAIAFSIGDAESSAAALDVKAASDNQAVLADAGITLGGSGASRTITLSPVAGQAGTVNVTVTVSDGVLQATQTFSLNVTTASSGGGGTGTPTLYMASLRPESGAISSASGIATLQVSADQTYALLKFSYSNLSSPKTSEHIHGLANPGQNGGIIFDIDTTTPLADGSYKWVLAPSGNLSVAAQVAGIQQGQMYLNIHTVNYPSGEIRGQFSLAEGSQTFTPPPPPPALPGGQPTQQDAIRFLRQASYGPNDSQISYVLQNGYDAWLNDQFAKPQTKMFDVLTNWKNGGTSIFRDQVWSSWWYLANQAPDQLRQRMTFALSEIFVTSMNTATLDAQLFGMARYYDTLGQNAFGNFRQLLSDVTLNPVMGIYLNMEGNRKANPAAGTNPNETYAREVLQLFSIGLNQLQPDGTLKLDANGLPTATYDQSVVQGMARVFTGWDFHQSGQGEYPAGDTLNPMTLIIARHETGVKNIISGVVIPAGQSGDQDLQQTLDAVFNHPNVGPFISRQLIQKLVCSNPSPAYVYRVAQIFNNNGAGVRGDLKAVVRAILTDYEARSSTLLGQMGFGKLNEPILRTAAVMRAFKATDTSGKDRWFIDLTDDLLAQTPLFAASVFNFYQPGFIQPGQLAQAGLVAPEFQITTETTTMSVANWFRNGIWGGFRYGDVKLDLSIEKSMSNDPAGLVDRVSILLNGATLPAATRQTIINQVGAVSASDPFSRAATAVHLVALTPEVAVQK